MTLKTARRGDVSPFMVMEVMRATHARIARGEDVLHMEVGQPSTPAPKGALDAARAALAHDKLGYTDATGLSELRRRIARHYVERYGVALDPSRIAVTTGSSAGFLLTFLACFEPGDRVLLTDPSYPCYRNILSALSIEVVRLPTGPETRFQPTVEVIERAGRIDGIVVASPSNPTGSMLPPEELARIAGYCSTHGIRLVSDEIYHGLTYGMAEATAAAHAPEAVIVNSFSKYWSMTGWRIGWLVVPEDLVAPIERLAQNLFISPPTLSQHAALGALDCADELEANRRVYAENRRVLMEELPRLGFDELSPPDGAFYVYAGVGHLTNDSVDFCSRLLADTGVAITPGIDFDPGRGHRYVRFSFAVSTAETIEAVSRLGAWLRR